MSGIYIKGMKMPKSCNACMFFAQTDYWNKEDEADILSRCIRTGEETWESVNGYLPNCPLIPVPDHGRLIDADALQKDWLENGENEYVYDTNSFLASLDDAPTIIPADKEDEA